MKKVADVYLPDTDNNWLAKWIGADGKQCYQYTRILSALQYLPNKRRRRALDIGAHAGLWTMQLVRHFQRVTAVEPIPANIECWHANCDRLRPAVELIQSAAGDVTGEIELARPSHSMSWLRSREDVAAHERLTVPMLRLDDLPATPVDLLKIDVEGMEYEVLAGAAKLIVLWEPVIIIEEKHDPHHRASGYLQGFGMQCVGKMKCDLIWTWPRR